MNVGRPLTGFKSLHGGSSNYVMGMSVYMVGYCISKVVRAGTSKI